MTEQQFKELLNNSSSEYGIGQVLTAISNNPHLIKLMTTLQLNSCFTEWCRYKWEPDGLKEFLSLLSVKDRTQFLKLLCSLQNPKINEELFILIKPIIKNNYCNRCFFAICYHLVNDLYLSKTEWFDLIYNSNDLQWVNWFMLKQVLSKDHYDKLLFVYNLQKEGQE